LKATQSRHNEAGTLPVYFRAAWRKSEGKQYSREENHCSLFILSAASKRENDGKNNAFPKREW